MIQTIKSMVYRIIVEHGGLPPEKTLQDTDRLFDDLGLDSLDMIELVMAAEEEFNIEIPDTEAEKVRTVKDAVDLIERLTR